MFFTFSFCVVWGSALYHPRPHTDLTVFVLSPLFLGGMAYADAYSHAPHWRELVLRTGQTQTYPTPQSVVTEMTPQALAPMVMSARVVAVVDAALPFST